MYLKDFQLCLRMHNFDLYPRCRAIWLPTENRIRSAIPKRYNFGNVKKIVLELGPDRESRAEYRVLLGIGLLHYPDFDAKRFLSSPAREQQEEVSHIVDVSMQKLAERFATTIEWLQPMLIRPQ